jgi:hypothetical protein
MLYRERMRRKSSRENHDWMPYSYLLTCGIAVCDMLLLKSWLICSEEERYYYE